MDDLKKRARKSRARKSQALAKESGTVDLYKVIKYIKLNQLVMGAGIVWSTIHTALGGGGRKMRALTKDEDRRIRAQLKKVRAVIDKALK